MNKQMELRTTQPLTSRQELTLFLLFEKNLGVSTGENLNGTNYVSFPPRLEARIKFALFLRPSISRYFDLDHDRGYWRQTAVMQSLTCKAENKKYDIRFNK